MNEVASSLLKLAPYDLDTMSCPGLAKYVLVIFPNTDWSQVSMKPVLSTFIRRLDKTLVKIHKNQRIYVSTDWAAVSTLLRGLYQVRCHIIHHGGIWQLNAFSLHHQAVWKYPYVIVNMQTFKSLVTTCQYLAIGKKIRGL